MKSKFKILTMAALCIMTTACSKSDVEHKPTIKLVEQNKSIFNETRYEIVDLNSNIEKISFYAKEYKEGNLVDEYEVFSTAVDTKENPSMPITFKYNTQGNLINLDIQCGPKGYSDQFKVDGVEKGFAIMLNSDISNLELNEKVNVLGYATESKEGITSGYDLSDYKESTNGRDFIIAVEAQSKNDTEK